MIPKVEVFVITPETLVILFVVLKEDPFPAPPKVKLPIIFDGEDAPINPIPIDVPPPGFAPVRVKILPALITNPVAAFVIVINLFPPDDVNVTTELFVIVKLLKLGGVTFTEIDELVFITTSCAAVGTMPNDQLPFVFQLALPPVHVLVCENDIIPQKKTRKRIKKIFFIAQV